MAYKYKPPTYIDPPGTLRGLIIAEIERWNDQAGETVVTDYDLPMKGAPTDPAEPATVVLHLRGTKVPFTVRRWGDFKTNLWAVLECIKQMRLTEARGMSDAMQAAYLALPAPEGAYVTQRDPYEVLELARTASKATVDAVARSKAGDAMRAGDNAALLEVNNAKAAIYQRNGWGAQSEAEAAK